MKRMQLASYVGMCLLHKEPVETYTPSMITCQVLHHNALEKETAGCIQPVQCWEERADTTPVQVGHRRSDPTSFLHVLPQSEITCRKNG